MSKRTFVISGAGSGIGRSTAKLFSARGDQVILIGRTRASLEETFHELTGDNHVILVADQKNKNSLRNALADISHLDGIIANAGIGGVNQYNHDDRWDEIMATNLTGTYQLIMEALPLLKKTGAYRHIVLVSSILARLGVPGYSAYCASKAGLLGLMRSLAAELAADKILVNAICPGWVDTQMARDGIQGFATMSGLNYDEAHRQQMSYVPLKKMSSPEEVAELLAYLTSLNQTSITGQTLDINNGALMPC